MTQNLSAAGGQTPDEAAPVAPPPRALKVAVIVMGTILIIGFTVVFITIGYRAANPRPPATGEPGAPPYETAVVVPVGAEVTDVVSQDNRALVTVRGGDGRYVVIVLDTAKGTALGRFLLAPD